MLWTSVSPALCLHMKHSHQLPERWLIKMKEIIRRQWCLWGPHIYLLWIKMLKQQIHSHPLYLWLPLPWSKQNVCHDKLAQILSHLQAGPVNFWAVLCNPSFWFVTFNNTQRFRRPVSSSWAVAKGSWPSSSPVSTDQYWTRASSPPQGRWWACLPSQDLRLKCGRCWVGHDRVKMWLTSE